MSLFGKKFGSNFGRNRLRLGFIFLGLVIIPSGFLGYFALRAIENERIAYVRRIEQNYGRLAGYVAKEINRILEDNEEEWTEAIEIRDLLALDSSRRNDILAKLVGQNPFIHRCFLLESTGRVLFPPADLPVFRERYSPEPTRADRSQMEDLHYVHDYEVFDRLIARAEDWEYSEHDIQRAISTYESISDSVSTPQFKAIALHNVGRVYFKVAQWSKAKEYYERLLREYPYARDLNNLYLRFVARTHIAICLENLGRDEESVPILLDSYEDLLRYSDEISKEQFDYFLDIIQKHCTRLLAVESLPNGAEYSQRFQALTERNKKQVSIRYFLQILERKMSKAVIERKKYKDRYRYDSDVAGNAPYLLAYTLLPDRTGQYAGGILAYEIDLEELKQLIFPDLLRSLQSNDEVLIAILNDKGDYVFGSSESVYRNPIAEKPLSEPFESWRVAIYSVSDKTSTSVSEFRTTVYLWFIFLLLVTILLGAYVLVRNMRKEFHLSNLKSTFVSNVSHELRTPLTSIRMFAELLEAENGRGARHRKKYLAIIRRECDRLARLIDNVLDFSKIERGVKQYDFEYEDPAALVHYVVESFRYHAESLGFCIQTEIQEDMPEIWADADAIRQVILNLLSNAVKYSDQRKEIKIAVYVDKNDVVIDVSDKGVGIDATEIPKIFEGFYRSDQRLSSMKSGTGLGLTLALHIVQAHGGDIQVNSQKGLGSTFSVRLRSASEAGGEQLSTGRSKQPKMVS